MSEAHTLYQRWITELWAGQPVAHELVADDFVGHWPDRDVHGPGELQSLIAETRAMFDEVNFTIEIGPIVEDGLVAGRWSGQGRTAEGTSTFIGNDILRVSGSKFTEYWVASFVAG